MTKPVPDSLRRRTPTRHDGYAPIGDYAVVGNRQTAALVALDGAIDWMCIPQFDAAPTFAALLDPSRGGSWTLCPAAPFKASREYIADTNVLQTTFETDDGVVRVTDLMSRAPNDPIDWNELVRSLECLDGEVPMRWRVEPRFDFDCCEPEVVRVESGWILRWESLQLGLQAWGAGDPRVREAGVEAEITLQRGDRALLVLASFDARPVAFSTFDDVDNRLDNTIDHWRSWSGRSDYAGQWRDAVIRSGLALELMISALSGSMIAAVTTSLPERIGGPKNWDYRYAWVRDTTFAMDALLRIGFADGVHAMLTWLLDTARRTHPRVHTFYGLDGRVHDEGRELEGWNGYRGSRPVRVGNDAGTQLQLGNFGDILQSTWLYTRAGNVLDPGTGRQLAQVIDLLCDLWRNEDSCIWELGDRRHYTQSKMTAWLGFHRAIELAREGQIPGDGERLERWQREADAMRAFIDSECFDAGRGIWKRDSRTDELDAAVLLVSGMDYTAPDDPRLHATIDAIRDELGRGPLLYRYSGADQEEGTFLACSFWLVEAYARTGRVDEAVELMNELVDLANDVDLYSEMYDPHTREMLGNFPQALTHLSLISAAFAIQHARGRAA